MWRKKPETLPNSTEFYDMTRLKKTILVADDDSDVLLAASMLIKRRFAEVVTVSRPDLLPEFMAKFKPDAVLLDMNFSSRVHNGNEGLYWLKRIKDISLQTPVLMLTAYGDVNLAVRSLKEGAADFILKPWDNEALLDSLEKNLGGSKKDTGAYRPDPPKITRMTGQSEGFRDIVRIAEKVAETDANILITGENGTGKDLLAKYVHEHSRRKTASFVYTDLGAVTESLFESELFGHKKGAFTDAREDKTGRIELAEGGTLFMNEIGNLNLPQQAKLLSVLENREIYPVGSNKPVRTDFRLICATNLNLHDAVEKGLFRQDLYYRIKTAEIRLPALRERKSDLRELAESFSDEFAIRYGKPKIRFSPHALRKLEQHTWPGNIRELRHTVENAVIMCDNGLIEEKDLSLNSSFGPAAEPVVAVNNLEELERQTIIRVLKIHGGNISKAADELGLTRAALYRRMEKYNI